MTVRYHVNPETGRANICRAEIKCDFAVDGVEPQHYATKDEAKKGAEKILEKEYNGTTKSLKKNNSKTFKKKQQSSINKAKRESADPDVQRKELLEEITKKANGLKADRKDRFINQYQYQKEIDKLTDEQLDAYANTLPVEKLYELRNGYTEDNNRSAISNKVLKQDFYRKALKRKEKNEAMKKYNEEKQEFYSNLQPMTAYQEAMSKVLIQDGEFYQPKAHMAGDSSASHWGDTRGKGDYEARSHFRDCGTAGINNINENASWEIYDTFSNESEYGVEAEMSCQCKNKFKTRVYLNDNAGNLLKKLIDA